MPTSSSLLRKTSVLLTVLLVVALPVMAWGAEVEASPLPQFSDETLPNGLRLLVTEDHEQPAAVVRLLIPVGSRDEPPRQAGLLRILTSALSEGTTAHPDLAFLLAVESIGGAFSASPGMEFTVLGLDVLSADVHDGLSLLAEAVRSPAFPKPAVKRIRREIRATLAVSDASPAAVLGNHARALIYGEDSRLGCRTLPRTVKSVGRDDLIAFHASHFVPDGAILAVMGDVDGDTIHETVLAHFASWQGARNTKRPSVDLAQRASAKRFVGMRGLRKAHIALAYPGLPADDPELPAWRILDYILGSGGFSSRLMAALRSDEGQTYEVRSFVRYRSDHGYMGIVTSTENTQLAKVHEILVSEMARLSERGITEDELTRAKSYFAGSFALSLETPDMVLGHVLDGVATGNTLDDLRREPAALQAVTKSDVDALAQRFLGGGPRWDVIVGDEKALSPTLDALGGFERVRHKK